MEFKRLLPLLFVIALLLTACRGQDLPPDDGTPEPPALEGEFASEFGSLRFYGDGRKITIDITAAFAEMTGLPEGKSEGTYVFIFRNEEYRRDKAEYFRIMLGDKTYVFDNSPGATNGNSIAFYAEPGGEIVRFDKVKE